MGPHDFGLPKALPKTLSASTNDHHAFARPKHIDLGPSKLARESAPGDAFLNFGSDPAKPTGNRTGWKKISSIFTRKASSPASNASGSTDGVGSSRGESRISVPMMNLGPRPGITDASSASGSAAFLGEAAPYSSSNNKVSPILGRAARPLGSRLPATSSLAQALLAGSSLTGGSKSQFTSREGSGSMSQLACKSMGGRGSEHTSGPLRGPVPATPAPLPAAPSHASTASASSFGGGHPPDLNRLGSVVEEEPSMSPPFIDPQPDTPAAGKRCDHVTHPHTQAILSAYPPFSPVPSPLL